MNFLFLCQMFLFSLTSRYHASVLNQPSSLRRALSSTSDFFSNPVTEKREDVKPNRQLLIWTSN